MISVEDWALIRRLVADGVPRRQVARQLGIGRATVDRAVASDRPPKYERRPVPTAFTPFEARVRAILAEHPEMPATVIAERVGWTGSITWFRDNVRRLRPGYRRPDPADRLVWEAGDAAQCDLWFPPKRIPLEDGSSALLPVLVMVAAHSRFITGRMLPTRRTEDLLLGSWELIGRLGRVPRRLIWDNEPGIGRGGRLAAGVAAFTGTLATKVVQLPPNDPESKGIVERRNGFFETSFMPGRSFTSPADFNTQFDQWLSRANARIVRTIKARPVDLIEADRARMLALPPVPLLLGWRHRVRLGRDYYVRLDASDYSVDPTAIGRMVEVSADLDRVRARLDGRVVADHARVWARGATVTDPAHKRIAQALREQARQPRVAATATNADDLTRDLADYDRAFGLSGEVA
ncbi:IS21 family transposase [Prauserella flavalba]|uniref:Transposase n=1 Tax=Prauserella flavalba TaxID=1477506 RepID=A0A318M6R0_9PSEU|nr:IS21 family transposase [Prauserella flavalba]PXY18195.1 transposase [Prauserella flavalba]PXY18581.1 transposase [Prauserella flavalba]PXY20134.1 transposase [Prauserella flavalba]PXY29786.1 transposase [Prauserella flavalba]